MIELSMHGIRMSILAAVVLAWGSGEAWAVRGICEYTIHVKSNAEGIGSTKIRDARLVIHGNAPRRPRGIGNIGRSTRGGDIARAFAGQLAKRCLDAAIGKSTKPAVCRKKQTASFSARVTARVTSFNVSNLGQAARNTICDSARALGKGPELRGVAVYAFRTGPGNARKRNCNIKDADRNRYYTIRSRIRVRCGRLGGRAVNQRSRVFTGWYPERGSQIRARVATFCKQRYSTTRFTIHKFEIKPNSGRIRAQFSCN